jgi:hypothetical protein
MMHNFHVQFTEKNLTRNAGLVHLGRFIDKIGLNQALKDSISIERGANLNAGSICKIEPTHYQMIQVASLNQQRSINFHHFGLSYG